MTNTTKYEKVIKQLKGGPKTVKQLKARCGFSTENAVTGTIAYLRNTLGYSIAGRVQQGKYKYAIL